MFTTSLEVNVAHLVSPTDEDCECGAGAVSECWSGPSRCGQDVPLRPAGVLDRWVNLNRPTLNRKSSTLRFLPELQFLGLYEIINKLIKLWDLHVFSSTFYYGSSQFARTVKVMPLLCALAPTQHKRLVLLFIYYLFETLSGIFFFPLEEANVQPDLPNFCSGISCQDV